MYNSFIKNMKPSFQQSDNKFKTSFINKMENSFSENYLIFFNSSHSQWFISKTSWFSGY